MRVRRLSSLIFAWLFVLTAATTVTAQPDEDVLELNSSIIEVHTRPVVQFSHTVHLDDYAIECSQCHHVYQGGENVWQDDDPVKKCQECHNDPTTKNELRLPAKTLNLKWAFHRNCIGCHREYNKENNVEAAPVKCQNCHVE